MERIIVLSNLFTVIALLNGNVVLRDLGEKEYREIEAKANFPINGACWHNALKILKVSCDKLNDHQHSLLALRLANCFLEDSGHITYQCHLSEPESIRRKCINAMSDRAFGVYNEFYTHTMHICFFLYHQVWQIQTEKSVEQLYEASSMMIEQLTKATEIQGIVLESQKEGLKIQNELLNDGKELGSIIRSSAERVSGMVVDIKESAKDQRQLLYEIFSYVQTFQNWVLTEVSWFQSIIYYTISSIVCALFSSSKRTAEARISLFTILSLNVIAERMLVQYCNNVEGSLQSSGDKIRLVELSWYFRKVAIGLCLITLFYTYYSYNNGNLENYKLLERIESRLNHIQAMDEPHRSLRFSRRSAHRRSKDIEPDENHPNRRHHHHHHGFHTKHES